MPRKFLRRYLPTPQKLREHSALKPLGKLLNDPELWHLHRRSASGAVFIGLFCAFLPMPLQMLASGAIAVLARCNLPIAVALVWLTNPLTTPPILYFSYELGAWLLGSHLIIDTIELDWDWLSTQFGLIWKPLLLGSLVCGWVSGVTGYVLIRLFWRFHVIRRWRARKELRRVRAAALIPRAELPRD